MESFLPAPCFRSWAAYRNALRSTGQRFRETAFARANEELEMSEVAMQSKNTMNKTLNWWDLMWISVGAVMGAGIFISTGEEARSVAGPAIVISYALAGFSSLLSALCFTEFAVEIPIAGGSFAYFRIELGEFIAALTAGNLILEFVLGQGAVARGWTSSFAALINKHPDDLRIHARMLAEGFNKLDPMAAGAILFFGLIAAFSTRLTSTANWLTSTLAMVLIVFIVAAGFAKGDVANLQPFIPFGSEGIFSAATVVYFSYLGFESLATLGEETRDPPRDVPRGMIGSLLLIITSYCLMVLALCMLQRYDQLDTGAPFSFAFDAVGWGWARYPVTLAALKGMTSVLLLGLLGEARYVTHIARTHVIPPWFAHVDPNTRTPVRATLTIMVLGAVVGFFTSFDVLATLFSISTLSIYSLMAVSVLVRRYYSPNEAGSSRALRMLLGFVVVGACCWIGMTVYYQKGGRFWGWYGVGGLVWVISSGCIQWFLRDRVRRPKAWGVPFGPWIPCASIAVNLFLLGAIDAWSFVRFGVMTAVILVYYFLVGLHSSYEARAHLMPVKMLEAMQKSQKPSGAEETSRLGEDPSSIQES